MRPIFALLAILVAAPAAAYETIKGRTVALDGDTIRVFAEGEEQVDVRLCGINAPEMSGESADGCRARAALDDILAAAGDPAFCTSVDRDRLGRTVAICGSVDIEDFGAAMIAAGWAVEYRKFTRPPPDPDTSLTRRAKRYEAAERESREASHGRWAKFPR